MPAFIIGALLGAGIATGVGLAVGTVTAATVGSFFLTAFAASAVLGGISYLTAKKPQPPAALQFSAQGRTVSIRQAISPWQVILGRARVGGTLTFRYVSSDRKYWHMVITLACHRCQSIDEIWFNDEIVAIDTAGLAFGKWAKTQADFTNTRGTIPGAPYQVTVAGFVQFHSAAIVGAVSQMTDVSPSTPAARHEFSRSGTTFTFHSSAAGLTYSINYFAASTTDSFVRIKLSLGDESTATQPFPDLVAESNGAWSADHKQYGHTKLYVRLEADPERFPNGVPNVTAVVKGALLFDPRTDTTVYSENAALAISHVLTSADYGFGAVYATELNDAALVSAANSCDENVTRALGGTEKRYVVGGSFALSQAPREVLGRLLGACAGTLVNVGDQWHVSVGVYNAPTVTLTDSHVAGPTTVNAFLPAQDTCNGVKGVYIEPSKNWQPTDFPAVQSSSALSADGNEALWRDVDYTMFVTSSGQAQRLAKIELLRTRQSLSEEGLFKLKAWEVVPGKTVARTDTDMGWSAKAFEVLDSELAIIPGDGGDDTIGLRLQLRETASTVYDWATNEDGETDLAPNTSLPDPGEVPVPGTPAVTEQNYVTRDGRAVAVKAILVYATSTYPFGAKYQAEYKLAAASTWTVLPLIQTATGATGDITQEIMDIAPGTYNFRVKTIGVTGASSAYSGTTTKEIVGLSAVPSVPVIRGIQASADGTSCILTLDPATDDDVRLGGRWIVRHTDGDTPVWESSLSIGDSNGYPGGVNIITLPLKPGTYLVKAQDPIGQYSTSFDSIYVKQASSFAYTTVATLTEDTTFAGAKSGVIAVDSVLKLDGAGLFDDIADLDAMTAIDSYGGVSSSGTYTFASAFNFGAVSNVRLTGQIVGLEDNALTVFDDRTDNIDDWSDFDGNTSGAYGVNTDAWLEARETDDDPSGAPTWSDWKRLDAAAFSAWGVQCRLRMTSSDPAYNRNISVLRVTAASA